MENKTPIEEWIEQSRNKCWPKQKGITNTESNKSMAKKVAYTRGCIDLLTYLGLQGIENPKEWVESVKNSHSEYLLVRGIMQNLTAEVTKLQAENIKLRNCGNCKHEHSPFKEGTPCLGCCSSEHDFSNWEGK